MKKFRITRDHLDQAFVLSVIAIVVSYLIGAIGFGLTWPVWIWMLG